MNECAGRLHCASFGGSLGKPTNHSLNQSRGTVLDRGSNVILYDTKPGSEAQFAWMLPISRHTLRSLDTDRNITSYEHFDRRPVLIEAMSSEFHLKGFIKE